MAYGVWDFMGIYRDYMGFFGILWDFWDFRHSFWKIVRVFFGVIYPSDMPITKVHTVSGSLLIRVKPHADCRKYKCEDSSFVIGEGEAVVVPSKIWNMTYAPMDEEYTLGYATTLTWDE